MQVAEGRRACVAAMATAAEVGLEAEDAIVLSDSNRLVVRLLPCDVVARIAPAGYRVFPAAVGAPREVELAQRLVDADAPVAVPEPRTGPRVFVRDGFDIALWTHVEPVPSGEVQPEAYAHALERLHAVMRGVDGPVPHFTDRVSDVQSWVARPEATPDLSDDDRALLADRLASLTRSILARGAGEQLLHGEPHPWNVLPGEDGPLFVDLENCVRGPIAFDLGWVPAEVSDRYPGVDANLLADCRELVLAIVAAHGWRTGDHKPGREGGVALVEALRKGPPWPPL